MIRSYALPVEGEKAGVLTDLSTGMLNRSDLEGYDWALLWYAQLPERVNIF